MTYNKHIVLESTCSTLFCGSTLLRKISRRNRRNKENTEFASGDARTALNVLEMAVTNGETGSDGNTVSMETLKQCIGKRSLLYEMAALGKAFWRIFS